MRNSRIEQKTGKVLPLPSDGRGRTFPVFCINESLPVTPCKSFAGGQQAGDKPGLAGKTFFDEIKAVKTITIQIDDRVYDHLQKVAGDQALPDYVEELLRSKANASAATDWIFPKEAIPFRPPGYFTNCYNDREDAVFEERICCDSKPIIEE